jgi:hypothetical protein
VPAARDKLPAELNGIGSQGIELVSDPAQCSAGVEPEHVFPEYGRVEPIAFPESEKAPEEFWRDLAGKAVAQQCPRRGSIPLVLNRQQHNPRLGK